MTGYGWDEYDPRAGGRQTIHDAGNFLDLTTEFVKIPGGDHGGGWGVRVKGVPRENAPPNMVTALVFSVAMEGLGSLAVTNEPDAHGYDGSVTLAGESLELGTFRVEVTRGPETNQYPPAQHETYSEKPLDRTMVASLQVPEENLWQTKPLLFMHLKEEVDRYIAKYGQEASPPPWQVFTVANRAGAGNLHFVQKVFTGPFEFDVLFSSGSSPEPVTSADLTKRAEDVSKSFSQRFSGSFAPKSPFKESNYMEFAKSMFSNLVGGIGYFYGDIVIDRSYAPEYEEENEGFWQQAAEARHRAISKQEGPRDFFTSIPSRPFFPRGFLWDEGFHLIPIVDWDMDLTLEIVRSWFRLMDDDGWIAREVILGDEARSKVPQEFQVQYPHFANPPTLFLILEALVDKLDAKAGTSEDSSDPFDAIRNQHLRGKDTAAAYLKELYPLLRKHYFWYRRTQAGDIKSYDREAFSSKEGYRWRGRTERHTLPSGLDDYPRAQPPHPGELHVDLISWMGMVARSMRRIATRIGETDDAEDFEGHETAIKRNIDGLHWDEKQKAYCDATIDAFEEHVHVCHKGYLSLAPFFNGLMPPDHPKLGHVLDLIGNPKELWSDYGIRSLSKNDELYGTDENYWRSPVWMNINYLVLQNLKVGAYHPTVQILITEPTRSQRRPKARTKPRPESCTTGSARTWWRMFSSSGRRRGSRGSSTIPTTGTGSGRSTSQVGRAWSSRSWLWVSSTRLAATSCDHTCVQVSCGPVGLRKKQTSTSGFAPLLASCYNGG